MSQASRSFTSTTEEQFALIEQKEKTEDWFFKLIIPAVFLLWIIGSFILLS